MHAQHTEVFWMAQAVFSRSYINHYPHERVTVLGRSAWPKD